MDGVTRLTSVKSTKTIDPSCDSVLQHVKNLVLFESSNVDTNCYQNG